MNVKKSRRRSLRILKSTTTSCEDAADCGVTGTGAEVFGSAWLADIAPQRGQQECTPLGIRPQPETEDSARHNGPLQSETEDSARHNGPLQLETEDSACHNGPLQLETEDSACHNGPLQLETEDSAHHNGPLQPETEDSACHNGPLQPETEDSACHNGPLQPETEDSACHNGPLQPETEDSACHNGPLQPETEDSAIHNGPLQPETEDSACHNGPLQPETDSCVLQNSCLHSGTVTFARQNVCLQPGTDDSAPLCDSLTLESHKYTSGKIHLQPDTLERTLQKGHLEVETHSHTALKSHRKVETHEHTPLRSHLEVDTREHNPQNVQLQVETLARTPLNVHLQAETADSDHSCGRCWGDEAASEDTALGDRSGGDWRTPRHVQQCETLGGSSGPVPSEGLAGEHSDRAMTDKLREALNKGFLCGDLSPRFDVSSPALGRNHSFHDSAIVSERSHQDETMTAVPCSVVTPDSRDGYLVSGGDLNEHASHAGLNTEQSNPSSTSTSVAQSENSTEMSDSEMPVMEKSGEAVKACRGAAESTRDVDGDTDTSCILAPSSSSSSCSAFLARELPTGVIPAPSLTSITASVPERQERLVPGTDDLQPSFCALKSEISLSKTQMSDLDALNLDISMAERLTPELNERDSSLLGRESELSVSKRMIPELDELDASLHTIKSELTPPKRQVSELNEHDSSLRARKLEISTSERQVSKLNEHDASLHSLKTEISTSKGQVSELNEHNTSLHMLKSEILAFSPVPCRDGEAETCTVNKPTPSGSKHVGDMNTNDSIKTVTALHDMNLSTEYHPIKSPQRVEMNGLLSLPLFTEQKPSGIESRGSKAERKSKKQRRRSAFGADLHLQTFAEQEVPSNLESSSSCAEVALGQAEDADLAVPQREETQLASHMTSAVAKKKKKRRSADVCIMAPDCQNATESTWAETDVENKCSTSKRRRSSLRLYRQQSHKKTELNMGGDEENKTGENSESHNLPGAADERNNTQQASQGDGVADVMADDLNEDDGTVSSELKQLYCNKNYKEPAGKTWETIFEVPSKGKLVSKKKQKRYVLFEDRIPLSKLKLRSKKAAQNGWSLGSLVLTKTDQDVEEKLKQLDVEVLDIH